jgi:hypothetical protein
MSSSRVLHEVRLPDLSRGRTAALESDRPENSQRRACTRKVESVPQAIMDEVLARLAPIFE